MVMRCRPGIATVSGDPDDRCTAISAFTRVFDVRWRRTAFGTYGCRRRTASLCCAASRVEADSMTIFGRSMLGLLLTAAVIGVSGAQRAAALTPGGELASHRAVY